MPPGPAATPRSGAAGGRGGRAGDAGLARAERAALARATGFNVITCRKALDLLIMDGILRVGPSPTPRALGPCARVAGGDPAWTDPAARAAALAGALAGRRRAAGATQPELAEAAGDSVTVVGHAETGGSGNPGRSGRPPTSARRRRGTARPA
jgi:hypothetical protein